MAHEKTKVKIKLNKIPDSKPTKYTATATVTDLDGKPIPGMEPVTADNNGKGFSGPRDAASTALSETYKKDIDSKMDSDPNNDLDTTSSKVEIDDSEAEKTSKSPTMPNLTGQDGKKKFKTQTSPAQSGLTVEEPESSSMLVKGNPRNHLDWLNEYRNSEGEIVPSNDGRNNKKLDESNAIPDFFPRPGDRVIKGVQDNNTMIVLGRDRTGIGEYFKTDDDKSDLSGNSDKMGAGAIDIVVGRGAPFPVKGNFVLGPMFNTKEGIASLKKYPLNVDLSGKKEDHPEFMMDAARIYISQMCRPDDPEYFDIKKIGDLANRDQSVNTSAIVLKADSLRLFARQDIKIVTGHYAKQKYNSQGAELTKNYGIHLIAAEGIPEGATKQQPLVKGHSLVSGLNEIMDSISKVLDISLEFYRAQMHFNGILGTHHHQSPVFGMPTTPSGTNIPAMVKTQIDHFSRCIAGVMLEKANLATAQLNYFGPQGSYYINSEFNTTN